MALLDPSLVDGAGRLIGSTYRRHVIRRLKSHIRTEAGAKLFRDRIVTPVRVDVTDAVQVRDFHKALSALVMPRLQRSRDRTGLTDALAFVSLLKRSMSTIAACLSTLRVVAQRYGTAPQPDRQRALRAYRRRMARYGVLGSAEEDDIAELEAEEMAASLDGDAIASELRGLIQLGEAAAPHDPKLAALALEIRLIRLHHPNANILVYTEYADSQRAAVDALAVVGGTVLTISGIDSEADRTQAAERCGEEDGIVLVSTDSLAEGLNLHQRCFHLIHLDLPYNPNRLEQRNGRIDRYGQRNDPEIRYLFLAGTFEERLLLHLIGKYEKARACLLVMPNTLGVGAHPASLHEPLFGVAEDLFSSVPRLVHSLDLAAEDADSEAYRDLLREIDKAFQSFDHMAVRHGWLSGGPTSPPPPLESKMIDLYDFLTSVLTPVADGHLVPRAWWGDLDSLPGFDRATGTARLTQDADRIRDADGQPLMYPGRAHPIVRRAAASVRTGRVSAARADVLSLLMTYTVEAAGFLRQVFALRLYPDGSIAEQPDFLSWSPFDPSDIWNTRFSEWAPAATLAASPYAAGVADRIAAQAADAHRQRLDREATVMRTWLAKRSDELCGPVRPFSGDLFANDPPPGDWRSCPIPQQRLAAFAADPGVSLPQRRDAADAVIRFSTQPAPFPRHTLRPLGMLMLIS